MLRTRSLPLALLLPAALALLPGGGVAQTALPAHPEIREAFLDWDRGEYPRALRRYLSVLEGADAATVREIAALTGEVYQVRELAPDGSGLRVSPDGLHATFQAPGVEGEVETVVVSLASGEVVATLPGVGASPGPGGRVAYLAQGPAPEALTALLQEANRSLQAGDRRGYFTRMREAAWYQVSSRELRIRELVTGRDTRVDLTGHLPGALAWDATGALLVSGATAGGDQGALLRVEGEEVIPVELPAGFPGEVFPGPAGTVAVEMRDRPVLPIPPGVQVPAQGMTGVAVVRARGEGAFFPGAGSPAVAADGSVLAWLRERDGLTELQAVPLTGNGTPRTLVATQDPLANPSVAPDGRQVAFQLRPLHDWEVYAVAADGSADPVQLSNEIQHDRNPVWVDAGTVLAAKGEGRHMRSYLYHLDGRPPLKLFHNNTLRTIAPEYEWAVAPGGERILVVSERDGDTVSPERGVYLVDRTRPVTREELVGRLETELARENALRMRAGETFRLISAGVREAVDAIQVERVSAYARDLYEMGSKYITQPGNRAAIDYLEATLRSWGYEPELQWFEPRPGIRTANVIVRIPGTVDPELVYVVSSHFDSVERGPGADDNSSGTTALMEVARVLKDRPMPTTIELAFFTGEEAGLLGSREYVRRAVAEGKRIVGALNNDMVGWANDHRLDNTIRYSNPGIRDIQHGAAILFSDLITYDALYYKSTDAAAYYEAYGDIVGGIGSYPVLGNPHYHQATDRLETIHQRLVTEVARTTAASILLLASAPSRLNGVTAELQEDATVIRWEAAPESDVTEYSVLWGDPAGEMREQRVAARPGEAPSARLPVLPEGTPVSVKALNARGHPGWDWATVVIRD